MAPNAVPEGAAVAHADRELVGQAGEVTLGLGGAALDVGALALVRVGGVGQTEVEAGELRRQVDDLGRVVAVVDARDHVGRTVGEAGLDDELVPFGVAAERGGGRGADLQQRGRVVFLAEAQGAEVRQGDEAVHLVEGDGRAVTRRRDDVVHLELEHRTVGHAVGGATVDEDVQLHVVAEVGPLAGLGVVDRSGPRNVAGGDGVTAAGAIPVVLDVGAGEGEVAADADGQAAGAGDRRGRLNGHAAPGASRAAPTTAVVPSRILRILVLLMAGEPAFPSASLPPRTRCAAAFRKRRNGGVVACAGLCPGHAAGGNRAVRPRATYLRHCGGRATACGSRPPMAP